MYIFQTLSLKKNCFETQKIALPCLYTKWSQRTVWWLAAAMGKACSFMFDDVIQLRLVSPYTYMWRSKQDKSLFYIIRTRLAYHKFRTVRSKLFTTILALCLLIINNEGILTSLPRCCCHADTRCRVIHFWVHTSKY